jgi:hypothetical protein
MTTGTTGLLPVWWFGVRTGGGGVLILEFLAQLKQLLIECQEPVTDGVRQVAVIHGGIG